MRAAIQDVTSTEFDIPEADGKWSLRQILEHMADSELVWSWRLRLVLAEDRPTLPGYDQDRWAARLRYGRAPIAEALDLFDAARRANLRLLDQASADDFARVGVQRRIPTRRARDRSSPSPREQVQNVLRVLQLTDSRRWRFDVPRVAQSSLPVLAVRRAP